MSSLPIRFGYGTKPLCLGYSQKTDPSSHSMHLEKPLKKYVSGMENEDQLSCR
jgi:hypothetical protein